MRNFCSHLWKRLQNFYRDSDTKVWKDKVTAKIILKIIAQKPKPKLDGHIGERRRWLHDQIVRAFSWQKIPFLQKAYCFFQPFIIKLKKWVKYPTLLILFLLIYLFIWHPALHNRPLPHAFPSKTTKPRIIPPRPKIHPVDTVRIEISCAAGWLSLFMQERKIASYPIYTPSFAKGKYKIVSISYQEGTGTLAYMGRDALPPYIILKSVSHPKLSSDSYIEMDDDFWEILLPYLREDTPVLILGMWKMTTGK
jgi:hypothetical protein